MLKSNTGVKRTPCPFILAGAHAGTLAGAHAGTLTGTLVGARHWSGCCSDCWAVTTTPQIWEAGRPRPQDKGVTGTFTGIFTGTNTGTFTAWDKHWDRGWEF